MVDAVEIRCQGRLADKVPVSVVPTDQFVEGLIIITVQSIVKSCVRVFVC